jgi:DNA-binding protein H-NS
MADRQGDSVVEWLEIDLHKLSDIERVTLIDEILDLLTVQELGRVRESADKKRAGKLKDARSAFITEMRQKAEQLDLTFEEVLEMETRPKTRKAASPKAKYRSPDGQEWSGRGRAAKWLLDLEAQGHSRDEFLIRDE